MIQKLNIENPKREKDQHGPVSLFPYYAGFSARFVSSLIDSAELPAHALVGDPWNGCGTTTTIANLKAINCWGTDLNPVMIIASKAALFNRRDRSSVLPLMNDILLHSKKKWSAGIEDDPIFLWFSGSGAMMLRKLQRSLHQVLIGFQKEAHIKDDTINGLSTIAAFFYVALFRTIKKFIFPFTTSNPTWISLPKHKDKRLEIDALAVKRVFSKEIHSMLAALEHSKNKTSNPTVVNLAVNSSCELDILSESTDLIITSPPYCTRIDYAIATHAELAILGYSKDSTFKELRRNLIGCATVPKVTPPIDQEWGSTCNTFLNRLFSHESKASQTYYYKNHVQYYKSIFLSLRQIERSLKRNGACILVVQDSFYKEIHNDLPTIFIEMAENCNMRLFQREDFVAEKNMANFNPNVKRYRSDIRATESVLCFNKAI